MHRLALLDRLQFPLEKWLFKWSKQWQAFWEKRTDCVEQTGPWAQRNPLESVSDPEARHRNCFSMALFLKTYCLSHARKRSFKALRTCWCVWIYLCIGVQCSGGAFDYSYHHGPWKVKYFSISAYSLWLIIFANPFLHFKDPLAKIWTTKANAGMTHHQELLQNQQ